MVNQVFPELFAVDSKKFPYDHYSSIAVSRLEPEQKDELLVGRGGASGSATIN